MSTHEDIDAMLRKVDGMLAGDRDPMPEGLIFRSRSELDRYIDARVAERVGFELDEYARKYREERGLRPSPLAEDEG